MPKTRLTQLAVDRLRSPDSGRVDYFDAHLPGFGLRASAGGRHVWFLFYRVKGKQRRYTLGTVAAIPKVDRARDRARELLADVARGVDPAAARDAPPTPPPAAPLTFRQLAADFIEKWAKKKNRTWEGTEKLLANHVHPTWGDRAAASITRRDVRDLLDQLAETIPVGVNRVVATVRKIFNWAVENDHLPTAPTQGVRAPAPETRRDRVLSDTELAAIWRACDHLGAAAGPFVRLLILTAQRRDEVAQMRWEDVDLGREVWVLPAGATKANRQHAVPLSPEAVRILGALRAAAEAEAAALGREVGAYALSNSHGRTPLSGYTKIKERLDKAAGATGWRLHDLRRTVATRLAELGVPSDDVISRVLNHAASGVTKRHYNLFDYLPEKRAALHLWARHLAELTVPAEKRRKLPRYEAFFRELGAVEQARPASAA